MSPERRQLTETVNESSPFALPRIEAILQNDEFLSAVWKYQMK